MNSLTEDGNSILLITYNDPRYHMVAEIRRRVFIEEQNVPFAEEWDATDNIAGHLIIFQEGKPAGTLRFYPDEDWLHVGRVAVLPEYRGKGLGKRLMKRCLQEGQRLGFKRSYLNSQSDKTRFYTSFGYQCTGDEFMEAGIQHRRMELLDVDAALTAI